MSIDKRIFKLLLGSVSSCGVGTQLMVRQVFTVKKLLHELHSSNWF